MKRKIKLQTKITLLVTTVVFVSISIIIFFAVSWMTNAIESKAETNILNVAKMIAHSEEIVNALETKDPDGHIASYADLLLKNLAQVELYHCGGYGRHTLFSSKSRYDWRNLCWR